MRIRRIEHGQSCKVDTPSRERPLRAGLVTRAAPPFIAERLALCQACDQYQVGGQFCGLNRTVGRCYLARPLAVCPADPPKWGPQ
jgi:hypothetical protein